MVFFRSLCVELITAWELPSSIRFVLDQKRLPEHATWSAFVVCTGVHGGASVLTIVHEKIVSVQKKRMHCQLLSTQAMNLRDLTKKYGRNKGLNIEAVQLFCCQLLIALRHLRKNNVLHADIKPDNILINHRHNKVSIGACNCQRCPGRP